MRNLKIGILGTRGIPNHYGGFEQFAEHLSLSLLQRGHDVFVYNSSLHPYKEGEWHGVNVIHCRDYENKIGTAGQFFYDLNCINDARKREFDILLHLGYTSDSVWHWRWPRKTINIVNMDGLEWQRSKYNKPTQRFLQWAESLAVKNADILVADSHGIQEHLSKHYGKKPVYIPYGAELFSTPNQSLLAKYQVLPQKYFLLVARMEPENSIELILRGYLSAKHNYPLLVIGNITNKFGTFLTDKYKDPGIRFLDAIYDQSELNNLRYFSTLYFHGHTVGGTNPSLLEAMACGCHIAAHNNQFNRAVLHDEAVYFDSVEAICQIIDYPAHPSILERWKELNYARIIEIYNQEKITDAYENLMLDACGIKKVVIQAATVEAV
jgi:glycosyltransferase involved in cell wall biosynthesis